VEVTWDPTKAAANIEKHGVSFDEAAELFRAEADYLVIFDEAHSDGEERFLAIVRSSEASSWLCTRSRMTTRSGSSVLGGRRNANASYSRVGRRRMRHERHS
jgi:uncharacterized DUF497 family protein